MFKNQFGQDFDVAIFEHKKLVLHTHTHTHFSIHIYYINLILLMS